MTADKEHEAPHADGDVAVASFSGGVDACFTMHRHVNRLCGRRSHTIGTAVIVHGFDIPLSDKKGFQTGLERARRITDSVGVPLVPVATNWRALPTLWEDSHATALAAVLTLFNKRHAGALMGSTEAYANFIPWGSNPLSDRMLSSGSFCVIHDGAEANRIQKLDTIRNWTAAIENLRVCWEGGAEAPGGNCGRCEKCVRTILNLRVLGMGVPPCFPGDVSDEQVGAVEIQNRTQQNEFRIILQEAQKRRLASEPWVRTVASRVAEYDLREAAKPDAARRVYRRLRALVRGAKHWFTVAENSTATPRADVR